MMEWDFPDLPVDTGTVDTGTGNTNSSRKRSRSDTPTPKSNPNDNTPEELPSLGSSSHPSTASQALANKLRSRAQRNEALNELLQTSAVNYVLDGDVVLEALVDVVLDCLHWDDDDDDLSGGDATSSTRPAAVFDPYQAWLTQPTSEAQNWAQHCRQYFANARSSNNNKNMMVDFEHIKVVEAVVTIFRNLSFVAANVRLLAYSPEVLAILVGSLYEGSFASSPANQEDSGSSSTSGSMLAYPAMHALVNIAPHLDVTGQKMFCDKLFFARKNDDAPLVPNPTSFGQAADNTWGFVGLWLAKRLDVKEDVMTDIPKSFLLDLTNATDFLVQVWSIFPALAFVLEDPKAPRNLVIMAIDLVQEFVQHARLSSNSDDLDNDLANARAILINIPDSVLLGIMDLLYIPRLGPDSLSYDDPCTSIVTRVNYLKLISPYEQTVDTDLRDRSLDILVALLELDSPRMAVRVGVDDRGRVRTRFWDALIPILAGKCGRNDSAMLASQVLKELALAKEENKIGLAYVQGRLMEMASTDPRASQLIFAHLYPKAKEGGRSTDDEEVEGEEAVQERIDQI